MTYSAEDYQSDLANPDMLHIRTRERFEAFYEECALGPAKHIEYEPERMDWIAFEPGAEVIELGCCSGANVVRWLFLYPEMLITAVDVSQGFLDETRRRVSEAGFEDRVFFHKGFIEDLPDGNIVGGTYTDVVLTETLEHVQDPLPVLKSAWELVAPGGNLWVTVPSYRIGTYSHVRGISVQQLGELLTEAGISGVKVLKRVKDPDTKWATRCHAVKS